MAGEPPQVGDAVVFGHVGNAEVPIFVRGQEATADCIEATSHRILLRDARELLDELYYQRGIVRLKLSILTKPGGISWLL